MNETNGILCKHAVSLVCINSRCLCKVVARETEDRANATLHRQREVIQTERSICLHKCFFYHTMTFLIV